MQQFRKQQAQLVCPDHSNEIITNYCSSLDCLKPLCPECMFTHNQQHRQKHTYPEIESIKGITLSSQNKLKDASNIISKELINLDHSIHQPQVFHSESLVLLHKFKKATIALIDQQFQEIETKLGQSATEIQKKFMTITPIIDRMKTFQKDLDMMNKTLENVGPTLLATLQKVNLMDIDQIIDKFKSDIQKGTQMLNFEQLILRSEDQNNRFNQLKIDLEKTVPLLTYRHNIQQMLSNPLIQQTTKQNNSFMDTQPNQNISQLEYSRMDYVDKFDKFEQSHSPQLSIHDSFQASNTLQKPTFENSLINMPNYFHDNAPRKFLHFFQNDSNNLFYLDLNQLNDQVVQFNLIELNNNFRIPIFHRSLATPDGNLYLTGGTLPEGQKSGITYQFDFETNSLTAISMLQYPRSSHGFCYLNGYLFVIGGYEQKHVMSNKCERMSPKGRWEQIGSLNQVCASMSICAKEPDQIFKFGGITVDYNGQTISTNIERYDFKTNLWKLIDPIKEKGVGIEHLSTSASVQINQKDILIFGGYNDENIGSSYVYILSEQSNNEYYFMPQPRLPYSEAFWNSQVIIQDGVVLALQNVSGESDDSCLEDERIILEFNGKQWISLD